MGGAARAHCDAPGAELGIGRPVVGRGQGLRTGGAAGRGGVGRGRAVVGGGEELWGTAEPLRILSGRVPQTVSPKDPWIEDQGDRRK